eukprot:4791908-Prymnesium_polylepis.1
MERTPRRRPSRRTQASAMRHQPAAGDAAASCHISRTYMPPVRLRRDVATDPNARPGPGGRRAAPNV